MKNKKNKNTKKKEANTKITLKQERQCGWKACCMQTRCRQRQREKGRQEYRGERANRDITLSLTRGNCLEGSVERDAAKYRRERANRDIRLKRRGRAKQRAGHRQTRGGEAIGWKAGWTC
ncbi:hypothetical protein PMAC_002580, partial [Pneumocystis sp. 'macacae']